jgi:hypothetical protein
MCTDCPVLCRAVLLLQVAVLLSGRQRGPWSVQHSRQRCGRLSVQVRVCVSTVAAMRECKGNAKGADASRSSSGLQGPLRTQPKKTHPPPQPTRPLHGVLQESAACHAQRATSQGQQACTIATNTTTHMVPILPAPLPPPPAGERSVSRTAGHLAGSAGARAGEHAAERVAERVAVHAGDSVMTHAGEAAAVAAAGHVAGHVGRRRGLAGLLDGLLDKVLGSRLLQRVASPAVSSGGGRCARVCVWVMHEQQQGRPPPLGGPTSAVCTGNPFSGISSGKA